MAEGAPLLREYRVCSPIEGSNPSVSAILFFLSFITFIGSVGFCVLSECAMLPDAERTFITMSSSDITSNS